LGYLERINGPEDLKKLKPQSLPKLCSEIRRFLVENISKTGGHLASNLGVVELSVALHYSFQSPKDKIIWDVGHQAYIHKILTGRRDRFDTLRQEGGISGFPKGKESEHDAFDTGHSSTSISAALGYCISRDLKKEKNHVIAVIGDGSMTGGMAYEALNNAGRSNSNLIVILNDNQWSISENVGALSRYLNELRTAPAYLGAKADVNRILKQIPVVGEKTARFIERTKEGIKYFFIPGILFEELGFKYVGYIDGHNIDDLLKILKKVKKMSGPVLLHVQTTKGKGYNQAEKLPWKYHGVESFDIETGKPIQVKIWDTYSEVFGRTLLKLARQNNKIVAITAAMPSGTGLMDFKAELPERFFDVGIAEPHAVTFAAGMAKGGFRPFFAVYSTFLQRCYDQILHDVCLQNLPVVFAIDRAGVVGSDGDTHQGLFDISFLSHLPNMTIMAPKNKSELVSMLVFASEWNGPAAIRYPRGAASRVLKKFNTPIQYGKSETIAKGEKFCVLSVGSMMDMAFSVFMRLKEEGHNPGLINVRFVKPLDDDMIESLKLYDHIFVMEENIASGGCGSGILERANEKGICLKSFHRLAFPDEFAEHGERDQILKRYKLDEENIYQRIKSTITNG